MNPRKQSKGIRQRFQLTMASLICAAVLAAPLYSKNIRAVVTPSNSQLSLGERVTVAIGVELSERAAPLGSYTAVFRWNPRALKFLGYTGGVTPGFSSPVVNKEKAGEGRLTFAHAYPEGGKGKINLLNLNFEVVGTGGSRSDFAVDFSAMASALTFKDLLPEIEKFATGVDENVAITDVPNAFALHANHPNPFNPGTEIGYELPKDTRVMLAVFNLLGQRIKTLVDAPVKAGKHTVRWNATDEFGRRMPSGVYLYRIEAGSFVQERKMILLQ